MSLDIPFHIPFVAPGTTSAVQSAVNQGYIQGGGVYTQQCRQELERIFASRVLITHSATAALEMAARLCGLKAGDEVIVPAYTFPTTASAIALTGATPVFVDVSRDTLNIDVLAAEGAITSRTRALMVVHYGGVPADVGALSSLAQANDFDIIEDAAQGFGVFHSGMHLGALGRFGAISFHGTKNVQAGEGGALLVRDPADFSKAEILLEKGTDRSKFLRGEVDKYTWQMLGSSFLPSELTTAYLVSQLPHYEGVNSQRLNLWQYYRDNLLDWAKGLSIHVVSQDMGHLGNGHIFALVFPSGNMAARFRKWMASNGIEVSTHYQPLHLSPAGLQYGRVSGSLKKALWAGEGLMRLPMHAEANKCRDKIVKIVREFKG